MKFRKDIEGLRAVAVILVVFSHLKVNGLAGGYVGVDIFFVISGYLITRLICQEYLESALFSQGYGNISLREFYFRRIKRIIPLSVFTSASIVIVYYFLFNPIVSKRVAVDSIWALFFAGNIHAINQKTDYFQLGSSVSPFQHFWSLAVEEHFYLVLPSLVLIAIKLHGLSFFGKKVWWDRRVTIVVSMVTIMSFFWSMYSTPRYPTVSYFSSFTRAWELGVGSLLSLILLRKDIHIAERVARPLSWVGIFLIAFSTVSFTESTIFPGSAAIFPVFGTFLLILSGTFSRSAITKILDHNVFQLIGRISFSVYLWHWPIIVITESLNSDFSNRFIGKITIIFFTFIISLTTHKIIEKPFRRISFPKAWEDKRATDFRAVKHHNYDVRGPFLFNFALVSLAMVLIFSNTDQIAKVLSGPDPGSTYEVQEVNPANQVSPTPERDNVTQAPVNVESKRLLSPNKKSDMIAFADWQKEIKKGIALKVVPTDLEPKLAELEIPSEYWKNCFAKTLEIPCSYGNPDSTKLAVVFGDSYAIAVIPMILNSLDLSDWKVISLTYGQCMIADVVPLSSDNSIISGCSAFRKWAIQYINKLDPEVLVITDNPNTSIKLPDDSIIDVPGSRGNTYWAQRLDYSLSQIQTTGKRIFLGTPPAPIGGALSNCTDSKLRLTSKCFGDTNSFPLGRKLARVVQQKGATQNNFIYVDPAPWLCIGSVCPAIIDNTPVFSDGSHFNPVFVSKLSTFFKKYLK